MLVPIALLVLIGGAPERAAAETPEPWTSVAGTAPWRPLATLDDPLVPVDRVLVLGEAASDPRAAWAQTTEPSTETHADGVSKKPLLYSLLLPGLGELSMGHKGRAVAFFVVEGLIWANFAYWTVASDMRQDNYIEQAQLNAGVGTSEGDDDYWRSVGQYERSSGTGPGSYEEELRREARDNFPGDPAAQDAYVADHLPSGDRAWEWSSPELQAAYLETRESSNRAHDRAKYSIAGAILNRVVSVIDVQLLRRHARDQQSSREEPSYRVYADGFAGGGRVVVQRRF